MESRGLSWKYWRSPLSVRFRVALVKVSADEMTFFPRQHIKLWVDFLGQNDFFHQIGS